MATDDDADEAAMDGAEAEAPPECPDFGEDSRKWLLAINRTVENLFTEDQIPDGPVKTAYHRMLRAAFDRMARICRSDITEGESR